jgi:threonine dehydrogenase-like Zn-dependent dehydrogenase
LSSQPVPQIRAAVLPAFEQPLEIQSFPEPPELAPGEVLVRIEMAGICGTDVHLWLGQLAIPTPVILGHETVGVIERAGPGLEKDWAGEPLKVGDRISWASSIACGECYFCRVVRAPTRCRSRKAYGISYPSTEAPHLRGGYAEKILLRPGTAIFRLPDSLPTDAVVGAGCALSTAVHGFERCPITWGSSVVIQGSGPVGLAALAIALQGGATKAIVIGGPAKRLEIARDFGAHVTIDIEEVPNVKARQQRVLDETGGYGADIVAECVGHPAAVNEGIEMCRDGGSFLVLGQYANAGNIDFNPHTITRKQLTIYGSWGFEPRHVYRGLQLLESTAWKDRFAAQITHRFPLDQAHEALMTTRAWQSGKTVIIP